MTYSFNPHSHVKIWLSRDPTLFLSEKNKERLIACRTINPLDAINFVYDSRLLNEETIAALTEFCSKYNISQYDIRLLEKNCKTPEEKKLLTIYHDELRNFGSGGNFGTASDILRWLDPIYSLGTYSDFDVIIDTNGVPDTIATEKPLLFNLRSYNVTEHLSPVKEADTTKIPLHCVDINNDVISVVDKVAALPIIKNIQRRIYLGCSTPTVRGSYCPYVLYSQSGESTLKKLGLCRNMIDDPAEKERLRNLTDLNLLYSARETRKLIMNGTKNNTAFIELTSIITGTEPNVSISNNDRLEFRKDYLRDSVIYTSGAGPLTLEMCGDIFYSPEKIQDILTYSYQHYGLDNSFKSNNFAEAALETSNDLSWLDGVSKANSAGLRFFSQQSDAPEITSNYSCCIII